MSTAMRIVSAAAFGLVRYYKRRPFRPARKTVFMVMSASTGGIETLLYTCSFAANEAGRSSSLHLTNSGEVHALYPGERDQFTAGPAASIQSPVESRIVFQRNSSSGPTVL